MLDLKEIADFIVTRLAAEFGNLDDPEDVSKQFGQYIHCTFLVREDYSGHAFMDFVPPAIRSLVNLIRADFKGKRQLVIYPIPITCEALQVVSSGLGWTVRVTTYYAKMWRGNFYTIDLLYEVR